MKRFGFFFIFLFVAVACPARIITVDDDSPADFNNIQAAINHSNAGDIIIVAEGTYYENINIGGKNIILKSADPNNPDVVAKTIIDGGKNGSVVVMQSVEDGTCILSGFTITNGYAGFLGEEGGGISARPSSMIIENNIITNNITNNFFATGNAILVRIDRERGSIKIRNNVISDNNSPNTLADSVFIAGKPSDIIEISGNTFVANGIRIEGSLQSVSVSNNTFKDFVTGYERCGIKISGTSESIKIVKFSDNIFSDFCRYAGVYACGIDISGTGYAVNTGIIKNNIFKNVEGGCGVCLRGAGEATINGEVDDNLFLHCDTAIGIGGTGYAEVKGGVENNMFLNCDRAISIGGTGGLADGEIENNLLLSCNVAISISGISPSRQYGVFKNNTIVNNSVGIYKGSNVNSLQVINNILWNNVDDLNNVSISEISYCNIGNGDYYGINGNICADPCFVDPCSVDYHLKSQAGRWDANEGRWTKDEVTSLCIDAGNPASPIGLEPFPNGGIINMGAYGGTEEASKSYFGEPVCETIVAGDINGDCIVNLKDFALLAFHWLEDNNPR